MGISVSVEKGREREAAGRVGRSLHARFHGQMIYKGRFKLFIAFNFISPGISEGSAGRLNRINPQ